MYEIRDFLKDVDTFNQKPSMKRLIHQIKINDDVEHRIMEEWGPDTTTLKKSKQFKYGYVNYNQLIKFIIRHDYEETIFNIANIISYKFIHFIYHSSEIWFVTGSSTRDILYIPDKLFYQIKDNFYYVKLPESWPVRLDIDLNLYPTGFSIDSCIYQIINSKENEGSLVTQEIFEEQLSIFREPINFISKENIDLNCEITYLLI